MAPVTLPKRVASEVYVQQRLIESTPRGAIYAYALVWEGTEIIAQEVFVPSGANADNVGVSELLSALSR